MAVQRHNVKDAGALGTLTLASGVDASTTSFVLGTGQGTACPSVPFYLKVDSEKVEVTYRATDTLTVTRGVCGSDAALS